ncbi:MAG: acyl-CoA dehydratase activase [Clostridium tyrobutyricum]|jgi:predicted CoA-substrate-specific enzyme activase|uniref:acyl-CoA dehydratase activase n=1 Tax=Clostridium tyrobutyricum TaxID=1519 RepID=UPI00189F5712|nr:acyl-CoA dehydratase activase [Clostridium tyrobutyricum]MCH4198812.1 acyl-CoA dehydratase activase [Clostridium tyrobutyricum]MCH4237452.1 acyl-CoA dehydratase activase [Clostridium tyrobutyricum]MCH4259554.1 acyl-CoA dehydratase activase [Clostridium tyrobutyricum]MCI1240028.1 acyl-CoA dehydratase activase [Clostridium tyrobutyricum]MCI1651228.1 acyl-CoA dehydratase activase [Clostridium tyrobutyricum]
MIGYVCKYTPFHIIKAFGEEVVRIDPNVKGFDRADTLMHPSICTYAKAVLEECMNSDIHNVILVNCCDSIKRLYDVLRESSYFKFVHLIDVPRKRNRASSLLMKNEIIKLINAIEEFTGKKFDSDKFIDIVNSEHVIKNHKQSNINIAVIGSRVKNSIIRQIEDAGGSVNYNLTCTGNFTRTTTLFKDENFLLSYSSFLLNSFPCMRMVDNSDRIKVINENLSNIDGIVYHTTKFCDVYSFEYAKLKNIISIPMLKIETDYTEEGSGQMKTRIEAFIETIKTKHNGSEDIQESRIIKNESSNNDVLVAGIDSGSTSTNVVVMNEKRKIVSYSIVRTGAKSKNGAENAMKEALNKIGITIGMLSKIISTGYGRVSIPFADKEITEITCHGKAAYFLNNSVRTIIDIGGQDSKAIKLDDRGNVVDFAMNDKCAAGTGRFLEMMSRTLEVPLNEMGKKSLSWKEDIDITSMCTVFAESEVVSLVAQNKEISDIIHGLNKSVATKTVSLVNRVGKKENYMMTGGVAKNIGVVKCLEEKLQKGIFIPDEPQIVGALGAALIALDNV